MTDDKVLSEERFEHVIMTIHELHRLKAREEWRKELRDDRETLRAKLAAAHRDYHALVEACREHEEADKKCFPYYETASHDDMVRLAETRKKMFSVLNTID